MSNARGERESAGIVEEPDDGSVMMTSVGKRACESTKLMAANRMKSAHDTGRGRVK